MANEILSHPSRKSEQIPIITRGRVVRVKLILPIVVGRMPQWLETVLTPYKERFEADSICPDFWMALFRLSFMKDWPTRWGSTPEQEWFVSLEPIVVADEERTLAHLAMHLKINMGMSADDKRYLLAPRGTWGRR